MITLKPKNVVIKQIIAGHNWNVDTIGLGSDGKLYEWDLNLADWKGYWTPDESNSKALRQKRS